MDQPTDLELKNIIDKLANFVARNGPQFEEMTKSKQLHNPKFSFLYGGPYNSYYRYKVHEEIQNMSKMNTNQYQFSNTQNLPMPSNTYDGNRDYLNEQLDKLNAEQQNRIMEGILNEYDREISNLLQVCQLNSVEIDKIIQPIIETCTKDSILNGKTWVLQHLSPPFSKLFSVYLLKKVLSESLFDSRLHIIYLINDLMHHCSRRNVQELKGALTNVIKPIYSHTFVNAQNQEQKDKLEKLLNLWENNNYFDSATIAQLRDPYQVLNNYQNDLKYQYENIVNPIISEFDERYNALKREYDYNESTKTPYHNNALNAINKVYPPAQPPLLPDPSLSINNTRTPLMGVGPIGSQAQSLNASNTQIQQNGQMGPDSNNLATMFANFMTANASNNMNAAPSFPPPFMSQSTDDRLKTPNMMGNRDAYNNEMFNSFLQAFKQNEHNNQQPLGAGFRLPGALPPNFAAIFNAFMSATPAANNMMKPALMNMFASLMGSMPFLPPNLSGGAGGGGPLLSAMNDPNNPEMPMNTFNPNSDDGNTDSAKSIVPVLPYFDLPAGLIVDLVKEEDVGYESIDPSLLRLPAPDPPSEQLLAAVDAFYSQASHEAPRNSEGWEHLGLFEFYKVKNKYKKNINGHHNSQLNKSSSDVTSQSESEDQTDKFQHDDKNPPKDVKLEPCTESKKLKNVDDDISKHSEIKSLAKKGDPNTNAKSDHPKVRVFREESESDSDSNDNSNERHRRRRSTPDRKKRSRSKSPPRRRRSRSGDRIRDFSDDRRDFDTIHFADERPKDVAEQQRLDEENKGHQLLKKMGWKGDGLGLNEQGMKDPISGGEVRDKSNLYRGIGNEKQKEMEAFEDYRKMRCKLMYNR